MSKSPKENKPYTYLIGWSEQDIWYYGVRYSKNCFPSDLWVSYFTSSNTVKNFRKQFGEPDVVKVRQTFNDGVSAINWEHRVLRRIRAVESPKWLNRFDGKAVHPEDALRGAKKKKPNHRGHTEATREQKRRCAVQNNYHERLNTPEAKEKSRSTRITQISTKSADERRKMASAMNTEDAKSRSAKTRKERLEKMSEQEKFADSVARSIAAIKGHARSSYVASEDLQRNEKIRESKKRFNPNFSSIVTCPHCEKTGQLASMKRWHFDSCQRLRNEDFRSNPAAS